MNKQINNIQECQKLIAEEKWHEAEECFEKILEDWDLDEARQGYKRARRGVEADLDFKQAKVSLVEGQLDRAYELLEAVMRYQNEYDIQINGSLELLEEVNTLLDLRTKREKLEVERRGKRWLNVVSLLQEIKELDPTTSDQVEEELRKADEELDLQLLSQKLEDYIKEEDWMAAIRKIEQIEKIRPGYEGISRQKLKVVNNIRWHGMYSEIVMDTKLEKWDEVIKGCHALIRDLNDHGEVFYRDVHDLLRMAELVKKLEKDYRQANLYFNNNQLEAALSLLQSILEQTPDNEKAKKLKANVDNLIQVQELLDNISDRLEADDLTDTPDMLQKVKKLLANVNESHAVYQRYLTVCTRWQKQWGTEVTKSKQHVDDLIEHKQWVSAQTKLTELVAKKYIDSTDEYYMSVSVKIEAGIKEQRHNNTNNIVAIVGIVVTIIGIIVTIVAALNYSVIMDVVGRIIPVSSTAKPDIPMVDRIEIFLDGDRLNLNQSTNLTAGQAVELEVVVFDTNGKRYSSDELVCAWAIAPVSREDITIETDLCKTLYIPSNEYPGQTVVVEVESIDQQFEPGDPVSIMFNLIE